MKQLSRREAIASIAAGSAGLMLSVSSESKSQDVLVRAFRGQHQPRPLSFDPTKLKGLSEKLMRSPWENNYGGAVKALNAVEQRLAAMLKEKDLPAYMYGGLKDEEVVRCGCVGVRGG